MKRVVIAFSALALATLMACGGSKEAKKEDNPNPSAAPADQGAAAAPAEGAAAAPAEGAAAAPAEGAEAATDGGAAPAPAPAQ